MSKEAKNVIKNTNRLLVCLTLLQLLIHALSANSAAALCRNFCLDTGTAVDELRNDLPLDTRGDVSDNVAHTV